MKRTINILLVLVFVLSLTSVGFAQEGFRPKPDGVTPGESFIREVDKTAPSAPSIAAGAFERVSLIVTTDGSADLAQLEAVAGGKIVHRYQRIFNGVSLVTTGSKVADIAALPGVTKVYLDELRQPDTERSPEFIGAPTVWNALGGQESAGEGVIVGVIDTGIWPEHPSFSDPDPSGKAYAPPPGGPFACEFGNTAFNPNDAPFTCNNKLIGAYKFLDTYQVAVGLTSEEFDSARDSEGHGTHTSSTAAGNAGVAASVFGVPRGTISGIAPRAHVIMYRVCAAGGCYDSDSAAAVEQAILDGVNVLNFSISGGSNPFSDAVSLAFLAAYDNGVFVAASAGNSGPGADTTDHREPWVTTVAASTHDRAFQTTAIISDTTGAILALTGASLTAGIAETPIVNAADYGDELCGPFPAGTFSGQIVICKRGTYGRAEKGFNVSEAGGGGMILYNQSAAVTDEETDNHFLPTVHIQYDQGLALLAALAATPGLTASWPAGVAVTVQGDVMASFSSRGGPGQSLGVSKPDITAPGVQILAGHTPLTSDVAGGPDGEYFQAIAGTSMSSPHIAGSGALLKALHPDWTPGQIKSALMTTALNGVVKEDGVTPADAFDYGSGRVNLNKAGSPGMTFDESAANYVALQSDLWNANYPSLYIPVMPGKLTVWRTVHSVLGKTNTWAVSVQAPSDVKITVPKKIKLKAGANYTFSITVDASKVPLGEVRFATIYFSAKNSVLRFPVTLVRRQPVVTLDKVCDPAALHSGDTTNCTITIENTSFDTANVRLTDQLPTGFSFVPGTVVGASFHAKTLTFEGALFGAAPPIVTIGAGASPGGGYLPLSLFGIPPIGGMDDETAANFSVPDFVFAGEIYSALGMVSDGYAVVGGVTGSDDIQFVNQSLPDPTRPNNVLAPFWSDLNPATGGAMRIGILTDGVNDWLIADWEGVANWSGSGFNSFQIWIGLNGVEDISYAFGPVSGGEGGLLTVGAENSFGNSGQNYYYNGTGTAPADGTQLVVTSVPSTPGETHVITFTMKSKKSGNWTNCAQMTSDLFQGTNVACFGGSVARR